MVNGMNSKLTLACRFSTISLFDCPNYVLRNGSNDALINKRVSVLYSTDTTQTAIPIVTYEEIKDVISNHPEKLLIDVREPDELKETGIIPTAINIPRKDTNVTHFLFPSFEVMRFLLTHVFLCMIFISGGSECSI